MKSFVRLCACAATFLLAAALPVAAVTWTFVQDVLVKENSGNPSDIRITGSFDYLPHKALTILGLSSQTLAHATDLFLKFDFGLIKYL